MQVPCAASSTSKALQQIRRPSRRPFNVLNAGKVPLSSPAVQAMKLGRRQAARHGSMFLEPTHILLGILQTPCSVTRCLETQFQLDYETARKAADSKVLVPLMSNLQEFDVDMSPRTRTTMVVAQECAREQGSKVLGTAHCLMALLQDTHSVLNEILEDRQLSVREVEDSIISTWQEQPETLSISDSQTPEQQIERLKSEYAKMQQTGTPSPLQEKAEQAARRVYE
ncbi:hypothetical protein DUNSADRAFT_11755 [Dunaliella salina]|uniref:Clp R domain-containing protein n=1 Tax=Dunaliella salina TaxID=3046 RepID=A0ABQ7GCP0_DUNSA|nr:hypothetical protein DUNSADRAFT_11755 [Dunaliella salina]|eukprot:KAF5832383.1 hypothetical protein DUNSADRAFT_11755 [Dunaliella salina]